MSHPSRRAAVARVVALLLPLGLLGAGCGGPRPVTDPVVPSAAGSSAAGVAGSRPPSGSAPATSGSPSSPAASAGQRPAVAVPAVSGIPTPGIGLDGTVVSVHSVRADQMARTWVEYASPQGTAGRPLLIFLHGTDSTVKYEAARDHLLPLVAAGDFTLVYPAGYHQTWNAGAGCCGDAATADLDDVAFVRVVTAQAVSGSGADPARIYLSGYSGGGKVGWQLVCDDPGPFAAIATYGANPTSTCPTGRQSLPVFIGFGAKDIAEPIRGQPTDERGPHPPAAVNVTAWRTRDSCAAVARTTKLPDVTLHTWSCPLGENVVYAVWPKARHVWPEPPLTTLAGSPARVMWTFLSAYRAGA